MDIHFFPYKSKHHLKAKMEEFSRFNPLDEKKFVLYGADKNTPLSFGVETIDKALVHCSGWVDIFQVFLKYGKSSNNKFILHGYSIAFLVLSALPFFRTKKMWIVWGSGLYYKKNNLSRKLQFYIKKMLYAKQDKICCMLNGDAEILKEQFRVEANKIFIIPYKLRPHKIFSEAEIETKINTLPLHILVGNQANRHHNHIKILNLLSKFKEEDICIHLFLNYPKNEKYVKEIIEEGTKIFKDKINFITEMLSAEEYLDVMKKIHITILDVEKQTGLAAIYKTIDYGGVVYLNEKGLNKKWLMDLGIRSANVSDIEKCNIARELFFLTKEEVFDNLKKRLAYFDIERIRREWTHFLND